MQNATCTNGLCPIPVPAPGAAVVFLTPDATATAAVSGTTYQPYGTDNPSVVNNSNGNRGDRGGATSKGSASSALPSIHLPKDAGLWARLGLSMTACALFAALI